jgi:hypothetical protein
MIDADAPTTRGQPPGASSRRLPQAVPRTAGRFSAATSPHGGAASDEWQTMP